MSLEDLDLSVEQRTRVEKIRTDLLAAMDPGGAAGRNLTNVLADGVAAGVVDRAQADAAIAQLGEAVARQHEMTRDALDQLHAALTAPQRARLVARLQGRWKEWNEAQARDARAHEPEADPSGHLAALTTELNLSQSEVDRINAAFASEMQAAPQTEDRTPVAVRVRAFASAFAADAFDAKALGTEPGADTRMTSRGGTRMARFFEAVAPVITLDQRAKLAQDIRQRASRSDP